MEARLVKWVDAKVSGGWRTEEEYRDMATPSHITSIGFVLEDNDDYVILIQNVSENLVGEAITIPRARITEEKEVFNFET